MFFLALLIPACALSSLTFLMMFFAYKLNNVGDNIEPWCTHFPILNNPLLLICCFLSCLQTSQETGQVVFKNFPQLVVIHTVKGFSIVREAEVDAFLEFPCFRYDPINASNLISGSSAFSKSSLYIWKFLIHVLLKPNLKNFEHYLASTWNECNCAVVWTFFGIAVLCY